MSEREILAEKIVALMFRHNAKARDLYDLHFLIKNGVEIRVSLIDKKMAEHGHIVTEDKFTDRINEIGKIWDKELIRLIPNKEFVSYDDAKAALLDALNDVGLL